MPPSLPHRLGQPRVDRVCLPVSQSGAGDEQRPDEEWMRREFDDPDLPAGSATADDDACVCQVCLAARVQPVVAVVWLRGSHRSIEASCTCAGLDLDLLLLAHERARERRDQESLRLWIGFRVVGVLDPEDVARNLDDCVLEPTSRAGEGYPALAGMAHRREYAFHAGVGTARRNHDASIPCQPLRGTLHLIASHPFDLGAGHREAVSHSPVRFVLRTVVSYDCDLHRSVSSNSPDIDAHDKAPWLAPMVQPGARRDPWPSNDCGSPACVGPKARAGA